jgi:hypothetical protein
MILSENNVKPNNLYKLIQTAIAKSCKVFEMSWFNLQIKAKHGTVKGSNVMWKVILCSL